MTRFIAVLFAVCTFVYGSDVFAVDQGEKIEVFGSLGVQTILQPKNNFDEAGLVAIQVNYNTTNSHTVGGRYSGGLYETVSGDEVWQTSAFFIYRYNFRKDKPTKIYLEGGVGAATPINDTGLILDAEFSMTFAVGVKRFIKDNFSLGVETRGIGTKSETSINEFSLILGVTF